MRERLARVCWLVSLASARAFGALKREWAECIDEDKTCERWARDGECDNNPAFMLKTCPAARMACQSPSCHDAEPECAVWAEQNQCDANQDYMLKECAFSCGSCFVNFKPECKRDAAVSPAAVPGTIDAVFREAIERYPQLAPRVLHRDPWIVMFDEFLKPSEVTHLLGKAGHKFERSLAGDGVVSVRTSSTSWCNVESCLSDPLFQEVRQRISNITKVPWEYAEHLQTLHYTPGQFYKEHHDQNSPKDSAWGPRLYTFFIYLSDVEEGGGTRFTKLNLTVTPKRGSAILWPSVKSSDPYAIEPLTYHEALTVTKGEKFASNFWLHMFEFQRALAAGCDNRNYYQGGSLRRARAVRPKGEN